MAKFRVYATEIREHHWDFVIEADDLPTAEQKAQMMAEAEIDADYANAYAVTRVTRLTENNKEVI